MRAPGNSRRRLVALVAFALLVGACGSSDDDGGAVGSGLDVEGSSTTSTPGAQTDGDGDGTSETSAGDGTDSTTPSDDGDGSGVLDPGTSPREQTLEDLPANEYGASKPGQHQYLDGDEGMLLDVFDVGPDSGDFDRTKDLSQLLITTVTSEQRARLVHWRADGLFLDAEQRRQANGQEAAKCDFVPDLLIRPRLDQAGSWQAESTCSTTQGEITVTRTRRIEGSVGGSTTVEVEGTAYDAVEVTYTETTTTESDSEPPLLLVERREVTEHWVPAIGLIGRQTGISSSALGGTPGGDAAFDWRLQEATGRAQS